jgi:hypothetical protein
MQDREGSWAGCKWILGLEAFNMFASGSRPFFIKIRCAESSTLVGHDATFWSDHGLICIYLGPSQLLPFPSSWVGWGTLLGKWVFKEDTDSSSGYHGSFPVSLSPKYTCLILTNYLTCSLSFRPTCCAKQSSLYHDRGKKRVIRKGPGQDIAHTNESSGYFLQLGSSFYFASPPMMQLYLNPPKVLIHSYGSEP